VRFLRPRTRELSLASVAQVNKRFSTFPFTLRALSDEKVAKMGVVECHNHELMSAYPVLYEKPGELVAQFKFTLLLTATNAIRATEGPPLDAGVASAADKSVTDPALSALLATEIIKKKKKDKKKKEAAE
jgi:hypothetical protein